MESVISIRNLHKGFGNSKKPVVRDFCMTVKRQNVYAFLGASGCGKTTILSCIVGLSGWNSGRIEVFGKEPRSKNSEIPGKAIGYMPQDLALYTHLTIEEMLGLYGRYYGMSKNIVAEKCTFLKNLLELPGLNRKIKSLSGGQKRRVSLALALIHSPKLLVLDEPTVGLDPLIREKIWSYIYCTVKSSYTTVLLTTHYVEEARHSDMVGLMRNGRLIAEETPCNLLTLFNVNRLEEAVLQICHKDKSGSKSADHQTLNENMYPNLLSGNMDTTNNFLDNKVTEDIYKAEQMHSFNLEQLLEQLIRHLQSTYGLTLVMLLSLVRIPIFLAVVLFVPTIQTTITISTIGSRLHDLQFGIVNHELANWTQVCQSESFTNSSCSSKSLSCNFLAQLQVDDHLILNSYKTEDDARFRVSQGNIWGYLVIPANYTQHVFNRFAVGKWPANENVEGSLIHVHLDYSQSVAAQLIIGHLYDSYFDYFVELGVSCGVAKQQFEIPLSFSSSLFGHASDDINFTLPGIIVSSLNIVTLGLACLNYITDHKQGTLSRAKVAGMSLPDFFVSHLITQTLLAVIQIAIMFGVLYYTFGIRVYGPFLHFLSLGVLISLCGTTMGLTFGMIFRDEVKALCVTMLVYPVSLLYGGALFPNEYMPKLWRHFGSIFPTKLATESMRSIVVRGLTLMHPLVWPGFVALVCWITLCLVVCIILFKMQSR